MTPGLSFLGAFVLLTTEAQPCWWTVPPSTRLAFTHLIMALALARARTRPAGLRVMTRVSTPLPSRASFRRRSPQIRNGIGLSDQIHMPVAMPKVGFGKAIEILLWILALGVLAENVVLFRQNRRLSEALAPQIAAGARLQMLSGLAFDGRQEPVTLPQAGSKLLILT